MCAVIHVGCPLDELRDSGPHKALNLPKEEHPIPTNLDSMSHISPDVILVSVWSPNTGSN